MLLLICSFRLREESLCLDFGATRTNCQSAKRAGLQEAWQSLRNHGAKLRPPPPGYVSHRRVTHPRHTWHKKALSRASQTTFGTRCWCCFAPSGPDKGHCDEMWAQQTKIANLQNTGGTHGGDAEQQNFAHEAQPAVGKTLRRGSPQGNAVRCRLDRPPDASAS